MHSLGSTYGGPRSSDSLVKNIVTDHEFGTGSVACTLHMPAAQSRLRMTASVKTLAPLVFGILKSSYSSRPPMLPICACAPRPHENSVPRSEKAKKCAGGIGRLGHPEVPLSCQRASPALPYRSRNGTGIGRNPSA